MKVPDEAAAGTDYANTAGVRQYEAFTDIPGITATYIPKNNIDPTQDPKADAPELKDPSNVFIPGVTVDKDGKTSVTETNNNEKTQATIGETITYTYSVTIAKGSTVYRGVLSDALPTGIDFVSLDKAELVGSSTPLPDLGFTINTAARHAHVPDRLEERHRRGPDVPRDSDREGRPGSCFLQSAHLHAAAGHGGHRREEDEHREVRELHG